MYLIIVKFYYYYIIYDYLRLFFWLKQIKYLLNYYFFSTVNFIIFVNPISKAFNFQLIELLINIH
jgi:hypothetical protein